MKRILTLIIVLVVASQVTQAQKKKRPVVHTKEEIVKIAVAELDKAMKAPEGELYLWAQKKQISGKYTFHISVREKGEVATVFCEERQGGSIDEQKEFTDELKDYKFYMKMPKGKSVKFEYTFDFNNQ